jgi:recombination protein RecA
MPTTNDEGKTEKDIKKKLNLIDLKSRLKDLVRFRVPTGIVAFDIITGGGIPAGRLTEILGDFSSGKSRLAYHVLAMTQKLGGVAMLLDQERALDEGLVNLTGLDIEKLIYPDPNEVSTIEDVFRVMGDGIEMFREIDPNGLLTLVWDSVAATPGIEDLENELGANMGAARRAKVISDGLKQIMKAVYSEKICLIFINQIREKLNVLYGDKIESVGGKAIKFAASLRLHVKLAGKIKNEKTEELDGYKGKLVVEKSRVCRPFGVAHFEMLTDRPIDRYSGLLDYLLRHEFVEKNGGWYNFAAGLEKFHEDDFPQKYEEWAKREKK